MHYSAVAISSGHGLAFEGDGTDVAGECGGDFPFVRIRLLSLIRRTPGGEACFCDLADEFDMPKPSLSHHLQVLVTAGVLQRERRGTWSWYTLIPEPIETLEQLLHAGSPLADRPAAVTSKPNNRC